MPNIIEQKALDFVIEYERKQGREAKRIPQGSGYDILSTGRKIEVKGQATANPSLIIFSHYNYKALQKALQKDEEFYLYIVYDLNNSNPKLIILDAIAVLKRVRPPGLTWDVPIFAGDKIKALGL